LDDSNKTMTVITNVPNYALSAASVERLIAENPGNEYNIGEPNFEDCEVFYRQNEYKCNLTY